LLEDSGNKIDSLKDETGKKENSAKMEFESQFLNIIKEILTFL
jgi:hypothetical protein